MNRKVYDIRICSTRQELEDAQYVRRQVFIEEQQVPENLEVDEYDQPGAGTFHFVAYHNNQPVGAGRFRPYSPGMGKVERVAVLSSERGCGLGRQIMLAIESLAREQRFRIMKLNAQCHARQFYEKLGYQAVGEIFQEAGIDHIEMRKTI